MTANNFNINSHDGKRAENRFDKKNETQFNFYKADLSKERKFSPAFQDKFGLTYGGNPKTQLYTQENLPDIHASENRQIMSSSMGFNLNNDFQKGMTLDKVLGGGFKKISIFDAGLDEFADKVVVKKSNRASTPDQEEESKNFDIAETEEEEDGVAEFYQGTPYKNKPKDGPAIEDKIRNEDNPEVMDKIQKKYKTRTVKSIYKKRPTQIIKAEPSGEILETGGDELEGKPQDYVCFDTRGRESALSKNESKSLSPKLASELKKNRFQSLASEKQKIGMNNTKTSFGNVPFVGTKKNPYDVQIDPKSQTQNKFRISTNKFRSTKENLRDESDSTKTNGYQKPLQIKALLNDFNNPRGMSRERRTEIDFERATSRMGSMVNADKIINNQRNYPEDQPGRISIEKKFNRQTKLIKEKIIKTEQDIMQKYSKMLSFNEESKKIV